MYYSSKCSHKRVQYYGSRHIVGDERSGLGSFLGGSDDTVDGALAAAHDDDILALADARVLELARVHDLALEAVHAFRLWEVNVV